MTAGFFDYVLVVILIVLAWQMLGVKDLFAGIVFYMVFGLLMALAWIQLQAPDIALVEAAIGSGLTGAFFLGVLGRLENNTRLVREREYRSGSVKDGKTRMIRGLCVALGIILAGSVLTLPAQSIGLGGRVDAAMPHSGVSNPVTAVILNFRAYDTLLEIGVLFLVALALGALTRFDQIRSRPNVQGEPLLNTFVHMLIPFMTLIAGYFLWAGSDRPGGAFQAGAIFSGAGVLVLLAGTPIRFNIRKPWLRVALAAGFLSFLAAGIAVMDIDRVFLQYPRDTAKHFILLIEALAAVSIAVIFVYLFAVCSGFLKGGPSPSSRGPEDDLL